MNREIKKYMRSNQVLELLKDYGPLTPRALSIMMKPTINPRQLRRTVERLSKKGFITRRLGKVFGGRGCFYQISQDDSTRNTIANTLNCTPNQLLQIGFRRREILHNDDCAILSHQLKNMFPDAILFREFEFNYQPLAKKIIMERDGALTVRPDILLVFPKVDENDRVAIAFEIEKTAKTSARIVQKLSKYTDKTYLAGLVYICDSNQIHNLIKTNYSSRVIDKAFRIKYYGEHFLMFLDSVDNCLSQTKNVYNSSGKSISIKGWINYLQTHSREERRDSEIQDRPLVRDLSATTA